MKPELKEMMEELQVAFNESVCESDRIAAILADIKSCGYEVLLALEVTIGVTDGKKDAAPSATAPAAMPFAADKFELTPEDQEFLQGMKIGAF
jgi:hypothetical protein